MKTYHSNQMRATMDGNFEAIQWHDSRLKGITISQCENRTFDVIFEIIANRFESERNVALELTFTECLALTAHFNLAFMSVCEGSIVRASYFKSPQDMEEYQKNALNFSDSEQSMTVTGMGWFVFEMDPPGGILILRAKDFGVVKTGNRKGGDV